MSLKNKITWLGDVFHSIVRKDKGSCSEAPSLKPKAMKVTYPPEPVDYNEFQQNLFNQIKKQYDSEISN